MRISETIERLQALLAEHGDLEVRAYGYGDIDCHLAGPVLRRERSGDTFVLFEEGVE